MVDPSDPGPAPVPPTETKPGAKPTAPANPKPAAEPVAPASPKPATEPVAPTSPKPAAEPVAPTTTKPATEPVAPENPKPATEPAEGTPEHALWVEWTTYEANKKLWDDWTKYEADKALWDSWTKYETDKALWDAWTKYETDKALWDAWTKYEGESAAWDKWTKYEADKDAYDLAKADYDKAKANYEAFKNGLDSDGYLKPGVKVSYDGNSFILLDSTTLSVIIDTERNLYRFPLLTKVTGDEATVTIDGNDSAVSSGTYKFARTTSASATVKVSGKVDIPEDGEKEIKSIVISETVAGTFKVKDEIKVRLYGDFKFNRNSLLNNKINIVSTTGDLKAEVIESSIKDDEFKIKITAAGGSKAAKLSISGIIVKDDKADKGDVAEIVVSGDNIEKTTLEVGTLITYGVKFTVEDKKLPVFYSGRYYDNDETLKVTFKESTTDSWWNNRKTTLKFPEGVKVITANFSGQKNCTIKDVDIDGNVVTFKADKNGKAEWKANFNLSISPDFTGDITCTLGGPAVSEDTEVTVAEAEKAVTFEVETKDVNIDYRNVTVGDIVIKEAYAGALKEDKDIVFDLDEISFEKGTKVKIEKGDIQLEDLNEGDRAKGLLSLTVKKESYRTPAVIRLTNVQVYLNRNLPAGNYPLKVKGNAVIENYAAKDIIKEAEKFDEKDDITASGKYSKSQLEDAWAKFNISSYTLSDKYIKVVTAGRDRDDSSFTTKVVVTIGAYTIKAGDKDIALDVPAYISNSYTMLPVRAVADALSGNAATVLWDDATKTVTIAFGARIISMKIGSRTMNINGVAVQMNKAPEITNSRTFLPLRDLAYALGLTDAQINWDDATKTATLN